MRKYNVYKKWMWLLVAVPLVVSLLPLVLIMASCSKCTDCTVPKPTVTAFMPICGSTGVALNSKITATFSEAMDPSSINGTTFTVTGPGTTAVAGTVAYDASSMVATFTPTSSLAYNTVYSITISAAVRTSLGVYAASATTCSFTTLPDPVPPTVVSTSPGCGASEVLVSTNAINVVFSKPMDPATITGTSFTVTGPGTTPISGAVSYTAASNTARFTPTGPLPLNTFITITVTTAVKSATGTAMAANFVCGFTTVVPPTVISTTPACGVTGVPVGISPINVVFSRAMDPTTINGASIAVTGPSTTPISGTVSFVPATNTAQFTPASALPFNTRITITVTTDVKSTSGTPMQANFVCGFTTVAAPIPPTVTALAPSCGATGVPISNKIAVTFSEAMDQSTITTSNLLVTGPGATPIAGTISYAAASNIATFTPNANLPATTLITVTVTTGVKDLAGTAMANNFTCGFTTALAPDTTDPTVISTTPSCGATGVALNTTVAAIFSEAMDPLTITNSTFTLTGPGTTPVPGTVAYSGTGNTATFTPTSNLANSTVFTLTVTTGAKDLAGNPLAANFSCSFTTGPGPDTTPPTVILTNPACGATGVALNKSVNVTFSEAMDPLTITTANFTLAGPGTTPVVGTVAYDALTNIATFNPTSNLASNTLYTFTVTTGVRDLAGNPMAADYVCSFTTAATLGPAPVNLGSAAGFVILAGSTVTNTGLSLVTGDLGLSPGTAVSGFPPGVINGTQHLADPIAAQAKLDLTTAYNDAAGRSLNVINVPTGQLGGLTLPPGLYRSGISSFAITSSDLTLDAQGDANAVFIFQMPSSTLTVGNGIKVILAGGAKAANIFWQVGSSATLGTTSVMQGTIMAQASITLQTGAVLNGRALAQTAAVTLDTSTVTMPTP